MSYTIDVQVLSEGEAYASVLVRLSIGETFVGGRHGIYADEAWTDDDGHATFEVPEYDNYSNKDANFKIAGSWYGSWDLDKGGASTIDVATDEEADARHVDPGEFGLLREPYAVPRVIFRAANGCEGRS